MMSLAAMQQKSGLHKDTPDGAGTSKGASTSDSTMEGTKLCLAGKQLPALGNTSAPHFL